MGNSGEGETAPLWADGVVNPTVPRRTRLCAHLEGVQSLPGALFETALWVEIYEKLELFWQFKKSVFPTDFWEKSC